MQPSSQESDSGLDFPCGVSAWTSRPVCWEAAAWPLCESAERAHARWGCGLARKQCLCRGKLSLPLHGAVLDCEAGLREQITLCSAQPGVQGGPGSCLPPIFNSGRSPSLGTLPSHFQVRRALRDSDPWVLTWVYCWADPHGLSLHFLLGVGIDSQATLESLTLCKASPGTSQRAVFLLVSKLYKSPPSLSC